MDRVTHPRWRTLLIGYVRKISTFEWVVAGGVAVVFVTLVILEPDIVGAPFESTRAIAAVAGGTILAAIALVVMLRLRVPPLVRVLVLGAPLAAVSWWLISPFFTDKVVHDDFETSIEAARGEGPPATPDATGNPPPAPTEPRLLGSGMFAGLAGHEGTGDAGIFRLDDGSLVLRLEDFDIENGPDLVLYLVPGSDRTSPTDDSLDFGALRGNVGDQTYAIPSDFAVESGDWTVLVWCRAFAIEFVAATLPLA
jgi:hypothetical protein